MPVAVVPGWGGAGDRALDRELRPGSPSGSERRTTRRRGCSCTAPGTRASGFRIFEVWETQADFDVFMVERLLPILRETSGLGQHAAAGHDLRAAQLPGRLRRDHPTTLAGVRPSSSTARSALDAEHPHRDPRARRVALPTCGARTTFSSPRSPA